MNHIPERIPYFAASDVLLSQATFLPSRAAEEKAQIDTCFQLSVTYTDARTSKHTHHTLASVCVCVTSPKHLLAACSSTEWFSKERNVCMCLFALERLSLWRPVKSWISFALRRSFKELLNDSDLVMCFKLEPDAGLGKPLIYDGWSLCLGSENALCHYRFSHLKQYVWVKVLLDVSYSENHFLLDISITEKMLNYWGRVCFLQD